MLKIDQWLSDNKNVVGQIKPHTVPHLRCTEQHNHDGVEVREQKDYPWKDFDKGSTVIHLESGQLFKYHRILDSMHNTTAVVSLDKDRFFTVSCLCLEQVV